MTAFPVKIRRPAKPASAVATPPAWVSDFVGPFTIDPAMTGLSVVRSETASLATARVVDARHRSPAELQAAVEAVYAAIFEHAIGRPVRFWNVLPGINDPAPGGQSRYMTFNAGRFAAFVEKFGRPERFDENVPTASAVGYGGDDLWVHCLSVDGKAVHIGNPRQRSPHRYDKRFGDRPPCFARATRIGEVLIVGGTASIKDQLSLHDGLPAQLAETLLNLETVIAAGGGPQSLDVVTDVRVFHPRSDDAEPLRSTLTNVFPSARQVEFLVADLCRPELLVEIEVVCDLSPKAASDA